MKKFSFKKAVPYLVAIIVFAFVSLIYFSPVFDGKQIRQSDIYHYKGTAKEVNDYRETTGEEALWTNSMFGGMPAYQVSIHYKSNVAYFFNNLFRLGLPHPAGILFVLMLGFFILLVALRTDPWLAIVGGLAFGFSTYFLLFLEVGHNAKTLAIAYMPAVLAGVILIFRGKLIAGGVVTSFFMAIEFAVNHIQMTYYLLFIIAFIVVAEFIQAMIQKKSAGFFKALGVLVIAGLIGFGPNIVNFWTSYEYMKDTIRGKSELTHDQANKSSGLDKDYITQWSYGVGETFTLMIPDAKGGASDRMASNKAALEKVDRKYREAVAGQNQYWGNMPFTSGPVYAGAFVVFLFVLGMFIVKGRLKWALFGVTVLAILLSWGHNLPFLSDFFIDYVPFYNKFRAVSSILVIACLTIPLLAFLALREVADHPQLIKEKKWYFIISLSLTAGIALLFMIFPSAFFNFTSSAEASQFNDYLKQGADRNQINDFVANLEQARMYIFRMSCLRTLVFILIGAGLIWLYASAKKMSRYVLYAAAGLLIVIDLVGVNKNYVNKEDFVAEKINQNPFPKSPADEYILADTDPDFRVLNLTSGNFTTDASTSYYHKSIGGYHAAKLRRYQELIEHRLFKEHDRLIKTLQSQVPDSVLVATLYGLTSLNMLNTRYFIYNPEARPLKNPAALGNAWFVKEVKIVPDADSEIAALDNFVPANMAIVDQRFEAELVDFKGERDPQSTILLKEYQPNKLVYETKGLKKPQLAVFSEIYYDKGWKATIDGDPASHFRANYVLRAMVIPEGDHTITFVFEPTSYYTGRTISLAGSILLLLVLAGGLWNEIRTRRKESGQNKGGE